MRSSPRPSLCPQPQPSLRATFRNYIRPLYIHRWVCKWALEGITQSPFHKNYILPFQFFHNATTFTLDSRFNDTQISNSLYVQCEGHYTNIPVYTKDNITVGYIISFASDSQHRRHTNNLPPFFSPYVARFIFDHINCNIITFIPSSKHDVITITVFGDNQYTFIVPFKEYTWDNLPDDPPIILKGATSLDDLNKQSYWSISNLPEVDINLINKIDLTQHDVQELLSEMTLSSTQTPPSSTISLTNTSPTFYFKLQTYLTNITNQTSRITQQTEPFSICHTLNPEQQTTYKSQLKSILDSRFFTLGKRIDTSNRHLPGYYQMTSLQNLHHFVQCCNEKVTQAVNLRCAHVYYSTMLAIFVDSRLLRQPHLSPDPQNQDFIQKVKQRKRKIGSHVTEKDREALLKERQQRNRLSAARSNARKQQRVAEMERDLVISKSRLKVLKEKHSRTLELNQKLKEIVYYWNHT